MLTGCENMKKREELRLSVSLWIKHLSDGI